MGDFDAADGGYGSTQCWDHPYRATNSGGVCALCVQERLCKLIVSCSSESSLPLSSSFPSASSSSSSSTPSFHSRLSSSTSSSAHIASLRSRMSFLYYHMSKEKKKKKTEAILRRTNSVAPSVVLHPMDSPRRRWFWPFSVTHEKVGHGGAVRWNCREKVEENNVASLNKRSAVVVQVDKQHLESTQTSERKVTRSRSVGCGNRSFSRGVSWRESRLGPLTALIEERSRNDREIIKMEAVGQYCNSHQPHQSCSKVTVCQHRFRLPILLLLLSLCCGCRIKRPMELTRGCRRLKLNQKKMEKAGDGLLLSQLR